MILYAAPIKLLKKRAVQDFVLNGRCKKLAIELCRFASCVGCVLKARMKPACNMFFFISKRKLMYVLRKSASRLEERPCVLRMDVRLFFFIHLSLILLEANVRLAALFLIH